MSLKPVPHHQPVSRIQGIDVLRGIAALTVVLSHYIPYWDKYLSPIPVFIPGKFGYYAVELFFVISGIVIFSTLNKCQSPLHFLYMRVSRLYPAYWVSMWLVAMVFILFFSEQLWPAALLANMSMFQEFLGFENFDNVYWSLTVELAFYLNVAWLFALGWHRRIITVCLSWLILACLWKLLLATEQGDERDVLAMIFALDYASYFVIGIALYDAIGKGFGKNTYLLLAASLLTSFLIFGLEGLIVSSVVIALASFAIFDRMKFMINPLTLWLGNISFSLYLIHRNLGYRILPELHERSIDPIVAIILTIALSLTLATLLTFWVERPALLFLRSKSPWNRVNAKI